MCHIWKYPTHPNYEITLKTLEQLPDGFQTINLTGGEPTLREDLLDICDLLYPKTRVLEISTNGLRAEKLESVVRKHPDVKIRISIEGIEEANDTIRGEKNGYRKKLDAMNRLLCAGATDLGFALTFQDENIDQIMPVYELCKRLKIEFSTSSVHNAFQFHKNDNYIYNRYKTAKSVEALITDMLRGWNVKNWFRAYLNLGLMRKISGLDRLQPCVSGTNCVFLDPWCDVYACNVRNDLLMGNLRDQSFEEIIHGRRASEVREMVARCPQNCWMVGSAKTAVSLPHFERLPKPGVLWWVVFNKLKLLTGRDIAFQKYVDYDNIYQDKHIVKRTSYLERSEKAVLQGELTRHYSQLEGYHNR